jgi:hypothetical protein
MVDHKQIAVAKVIGTIAILALAMPVAGMTVNATTAHPGWAEAFARLGVKSIYVLEEIFAVLEAGLPIVDGINGWSRSRIALAKGGAQLTSRIPLIGGEHIVGLSKLVIGRHQGT